MRCIPAPLALTPTLSQRERGQNRQHGRSAQKRSNQFDRLVDHGLLQTHTVLVEALQRAGAQWALSQLSGYGQRLGGGFPRLYGRRLHFHVLRQRFGEQPQRLCGRRHRQQSAGRGRGAGTGVRGVSWVCGRLAVLPNTASAGIMVKSASSAYASSASSYSNNSNIACIQALTQMLKTLKKVHC